MDCCNIWKLVVDIESCHCIAELDIVDIRRRLGVVGCSNIHLALLEVVDNIVAVVDTEGLDCKQVLVSLD